MTDPFPELTQFLQAILYYLIFLGIILSAISFIVAGIIFLPIFGLSAQRASIGTRALYMTVIGLIIIVLALPARNAILHYFSTPAGMPKVPLTDPVITPTPTAGS